LKIQRDAATLRAVIKQKLATQPLTRGEVFAMFDVEDMELDTVLHSDALLIADALVDLSWDEEITMSRHGKVYSLVGNIDDAPPAMEHNRKGKPRKRMNGRFVSRKSTLPHYMNWQQYTTRNKGPQFDEVAEAM
jgi:hypothetical protein